MVTPLFILWLLKIQAVLNDKCVCAPTGENPDISEPITKKPRVHATRLDTLLGMNPCPVGTPIEIHKDSVLRFYNKVKQGCREEMRTAEDSKEKDPASAVAAAAPVKKSLFNCRESWNSLTNQSAMNVAMHTLKAAYGNFKMDDAFIKEQLKTTHKGKWDNYRKVQKEKAAHDREVASVVADQGAPQGEEKKNSLLSAAEKAKKTVSQRSRHAAACRRVFHSPLAHHFPAES